MLPTRSSIRRAYSAFSHMPLWNSRFWHCVAGGMSNSDNEPHAPLDQQPVSDDEPATVAWFDLDKQFGFVALNNGYGDAFLHMSVLKAAGYVWLPRGTTVRVRIEEGGSKRRVAEVLDIDTSTARPGESEPILRKPKA